MKNCYSRNKLVLLLLGAFCTSHFQEMQAADLNVLYPKPSHAELEKVRANQNLSKDIKSYLAFLNQPYPSILRDDLKILFNGQQLPSKDQLEVIKKVVTAPSKITVVEGVPGAGKTSGVLNWVVLFVKSFAQGKKIYVSAPNDGGMKAVNGDFSKNKEVEIYNLQQLIDMDLESDAFIIIDECYMMNRAQLKNFLAKANLKNWRVLFTCDSQQNLPQDSIYALFSDIPTFHLTTSFRAKKMEEREFVKVYGEARKLNDSDAMKKALSILYKHQPDYDYLGDALAKIADMQGCLVGINNIFLSFEPTKTGQDAHILATANWVEYYKNKGELGDIMIVVDESDKDSVRNELVKKGIDDLTIGSILKTSSASQGAGAKHVAIVLSKNMTESDIYVALSRQKEDVLVFVPIDAKPNHFINRNEILNYRYQSMQNKEKIKRRFEDVYSKIVEDTREKKKARMAEETSKPGEVSPGVVPNPIVPKA